MFSSVTSWWYPLVSAFACLGFLGAGLFVSQHSLDKLHDLRRMERVPAKVAGSILPGETNITGVVQPAVSYGLVRSPETDVPVVYFRYHIERETRDSDGNTSWRTVSNSVERVPFMLSDETGTVRVVPDRYVRVNARLDFRERRGNMRYSEYRIHPGDTVFVLGEAMREAAINPSEGGESLFVGFGEASFRPIISQWSEAEERASIGGWSVLYSWFGLVLLSCSVVFLFGVFRWHNTMVYLVAVTVVMVLALLGQGYYMMEADLDDARDRVNRHLETAAQELVALTGIDLAHPENGGAAVMGFYGMTPDSWSEHLLSLSEGDRDRFERIRVDAARRIDAYNSVLKRFPEKLLTTRWGHSLMEPLELSQQETEQLLRLDAAYVPTRLSNSWAGYVMGIGLFAGILLAWFGIRAVRTKRMMENVPTSPINGVSYGLTEVKGIVEVPEEDLLSGPLSNKDVCWYHYTVEEQRGSGKDRKWVTITRRVSTQPFWCVDESGRIKVHPSDATVFTRQKMTKRKGKRRYREYAILPGEGLYVLGSAGINPETHEHLELRCEADASFPYIVSTERESVVMYRYGRKGRWSLNFGLNGAVLAALIAYGSMGNFSPTDYMASALIGSSYLFVLVSVLLFNDLVFLRHRAKRNFANIDVSLKKRTDIVKNLELVAREIAAHEKELLNLLAQFRTIAHADEVERESNASTYHPFSDRLLAIQESYPDLKSHASFVRLMEELVHLENEVAIMRQGYNDAVEHLNYRVKSVPDALIARAFGFKERRYWQAHLTEPTSTAQTSE